MSEGVVSAEVGSPSTDAGRLLRQAREARRLSVEDIAQALKLTPKQVVAIERDEFDLLPGKTFARGFVKNYARLLQVDPAPLLTAVDAHVAGGEVDLRPLSNAAGRMPASSSPSGVPRVLLAGLVIAALALGVGVYLERFGPLDYLAVAKDINQTELYKQAAAQVGVPVPKSDFRTSKLIDGVVWDGKDPKKYAASFKVRA